MLVLHSQEKTALGILLFVTLICTAGTMILDGMGRERFSTEYQPGMADGTLVSWQGVVGEMYHAKGGSIIMDVSGVTIFIPVSAGDIPNITAGSSVRIIGTVQHWKGKEEILIEDGKDISLLS